MRSANLFAAFRHLATANLPGKTGWLAALPILRQVFPYDEDALFWYGEGNEIADLQVSTAEAASAASVYLRDFLNQLETEAMPGYSEFITSGMAVDHMSRYPRYRESAFHREITGPMGIGHMIRFALRPQGALPICLTFGRGGARGFGERESGRLLELRPLLAHILAGKGIVPSDEEFAGHDHELLVADAEGRIHLASAKAIYLMHRAAGHLVCSGTITDHAYGAIRPLLRELARRVARLELGQDSGLPLHSCRQADGRYTFRAYRLSNLAGKGNLVAIQIQHHVPLLVRLYQAGRLQTLPPREQELVPLLLQGRSTTAIATALTIAPSTVIGYLRSLYMRLGISCRGDLLPALLDVTQSAAAIA